MHPTVQPQSGHPTSPLEEYDARVKDGRLTGDEAQRQVMQRLEQLYTEVLAPDKGLIGKLFSKTPAAPRSVYIWGPVGRGKSLLMDMFYGRLDLAHTERTHFHAFMQNVHAMMHAWRKEVEHKKLREDAFSLTLRDLASDYRLICLDELQVTDVADAMILGKLFSELLTSGVTFVITSNRPPAELYKGGLQREQFLEFVRVIETQMDVVELASPQDYRMQQLRAMEAVYMTPLNAKTDALLQEKFSEMTHRAVLTPDTIEVQGRILHIYQSYGGIAQFSFAELCENPLGAADYLAIAHRFHTVFLRDIPQLGKNKRNESKRFVTLIDTLYDHRVKLICTADAPPEVLYPEGDGVFEFARTVSRLAEMRSGQYLQLPHIP
jgi:cell division protein ZapE